MTAQSLEAPCRGTAHGSTPYRRTIRQVPGYVITANDVLDGGVRYLRRAALGCEWTLDIAAATATSNARDRDALLAMAEANAQRSFVVSPYAIEIVRDGIRIAHRSTRERIRATGPTIRPGNGAHR